jgi:hypothetical protein
MAIFTPKDVFVISQQYRGPMRRYIEHTVRFFSSPHDFFFEYMFMNHVLIGLCCRCVGGQVIKIADIDIALVDGNVDSIYVMARDTQSGDALAASAGEAVTRLLGTGAGAGAGAERGVSIVPVTHIYLYACLDASAVIPLIPLDHCSEALESKSIPQWTDIFGGAAGE